SIYTTRIGESFRSSIHRSTEMMLFNLLALRITAFLVQDFRGQILEDKYLTAIVLTGAVLVSSFLSSMLIFLSGRRRFQNLKSETLKTAKSAIYPGFFVLFFLPAAIQTKSSYSGAWDWNLIMAVVTIVLVQTGLSLMLDRARFSHSRTRFIENELGRHSEILTSLDTSIKALKSLADFWYQAAEPEAVRVSWKNISMIMPPGYEEIEKAPLRKQGEEGLLLEVWPTPRTTLDLERVEIFILQTETVLKHLELRKSLVRSGWKCLEAMVYSLDMADSRQTGYSSRVAETAREMGTVLGITEEKMENLEMAAMLHLTAGIMEKAQQDWQAAFASDPSGTKFQLPQVVVDGIRHLKENFDGTGKPTGLKGRDIPEISRILRVASDFATGISDQTEENSLLEIRRREGTIYDPRMVDVLETILENRSAGSVGRTG
ncbi:MAG: hypothetical protein GF388_03090, partial [Candidatus Aegiribacteria sp.]|nr:hypothetical protein [Candidatus Aegiribacteria sp.]MBD3294257.1 hypothetical protein [Candidatus Fermentibacteria bacterium]